MATQTIDNIKTISNQIKYGSTLELSFKNFHEQDVLHVTDDSKIIMSTLSILNDYWYFIQNYVVTVTLTDDEIHKYEYKPKLMAYDLYGSIEFYYLILRINNMDSVSDFGGFKTLKLFRREVISFLNEVYIKEKKKITANISKVKSESEN